MCWVVDIIYEDEVYYKVFVFGNDFYFYLKWNKRFLVLNFKVEVLGKNGNVMKRYVMENCYYVGNLKDRLILKVVISNC